MKGAEDEGGVVERAPHQNHGDGEPSMPRRNPESRCHPQVSSWAVDIQ
ncbi:hypothetical protein [Streptomyces boluensis]|nr:hypothetical protein [Streptomyces boluensis]